MSQEWIAQARPMDELTVIKNPFDEYFDPILFYVHRKVHVIRDDLGTPPCAEQRLYLARRQWMQEASERLQGRVTEVATLREIGSMLKEGDRRELVIFRCQPVRMDLIAQGSEAKPLPATKADLGLLFNFHDGKKSSMYRSGYICGFSPSLKLNINPTSTFSLRVGFASLP
jgi:hypothetical protein